MRCRRRLIRLEDMESAPPTISAQPTTCGLAIASVICGPLGFLTAGLSGIAAIITGHMALGAIKRSGGFLKGTGMAITGLVTGYISILILPIAILAGLAAPVILKQRQAADRVEATNNVKSLHVTLMEFDNEHGSFPSDELAKKESSLAGLTGPSVLKQLEAAGSVRDLDRLLAVRGKPHSNWYYFPGSSTSSDPEKPLLVTPVIGDKIVVLRVDGSVTPEYVASPSPIDLTGAVEIPVPKKKR